jgi:thiol-disulfide isomerase/thioredoxin
MWILSFCAVASEPSPILDGADARYLAESGRQAQAAAWYLERLDERLVDYLGVLGLLPSWRTPALVAQVEAWRQEHPDRVVDGAVGLALAHARAATPLYGYAPMRGLGEAGAWCEPALEALSIAPEGAEDRYEVLKWRVRVLQACERPLDEELAAAAALALSGEAGANARAFHGLKDSVDAEDLRAVQGALSEEAWSLSNFVHAFAEDRSGPALEEVRGALLAAARAQARSDRPAQVAEAVAIFRAAGLLEEETAARVRLKQLDPGNQANVKALERLKEPTTREGPPDPQTLLDPAQRLEALLGQGRPKSIGDRLLWLGALADAAEALGDQERQLWALRRLWPGSPGVEANLRYARATVEAGRRLRQGERAAGHAVRALRDPWTYRLTTGRGPPPDAAWRADLARALEAQALVAEARGRAVAAIDSLEEALLLDEPTAGRLFRLGALYDAAGRVDAAVPLLARAVALAPQDPQAAAATARLSVWLADSPGWMPDVDTYLASVRAGVEAPPPPETADAARFADLVVRMGGAEQRLFDLEGPIVLDLWATWCGPCTASLPHLDLLARRYEGQVTFVAASVDADPLTADRYLSRRGEAAFVAAFLGKDGMARVGVTGIPAMFVFDAQHRLVERLSGWSPNSTELDQAVEALFR